jgi:hypothetical protein
VSRLTHADPAEPGSGPRWIKSSLSFCNSNCVEVASLPDGHIGVRDSKDSEGPVLRFTSNEWNVFLRGARHGGFDLVGQELSLRAWRHGVAARLVGEISGEGPSRASRGLRPFGQAGWCGSYAVFAVLAWTRAERKIITGMKTLSCAAVNAAATLTCAASSR